MKRKTHNTEPSADYPPGYFTELIVAHNWPPQWRSQIVEPKLTAQQLAVRAAARIAMQKRKDGVGWGNGTIPMPNTPKHTAPAWQVRRAV